MNRAETIYLAYTCKRILENNWTELPMPNKIVDDVHQQARGNTFTDKDRNIITEIDDDEDDQGM